MKCSRINSLILALFSEVVSILCINWYSCLLQPSHEATSNNAIVTKHICRAYYSWYGGNLPKAYLCPFWRTHSISTVFFADLCWFLMFWLKRPLKSVFTYSKYRNDNLPDLKMQLDAFPRLFMNAWSSLKFFTWFSCQTCGLYIIHILF